MNQPAHERSAPRETLRLMFAPWLLYRVALPLAIAGITYVTRAKPYFSVELLLWIGFLAHMLVTFGLKRRHVLDTGSFFCLMFCYAGVAEISEARGNFTWPQSIAAAVALAAYLALSFIGRFRAVRDAPPASQRPVSAGEVIVAVLGLLLAVVLFSSDKTTVGLLLVPPMLLVPLVLLYSLCRKESKSPPAR